jgi:acetyl-CoA carboxylase biotin carboxyl carrier protein
MTEELLAPMRGVILKIKVNVGDAVEEDEEIMIMESMKLEAGINAHCAGVVKELRVSVGDKVEEDDVLAIIG